MKIFKCLQSGIVGFSRSVSQYISAVILALSFKISKLRKYTLIDMKSSISLACFTEYIVEMSKNRYDSVEFKQMQLYPVTSFTCRTKRLLLYCGRVAS